MSSTWVAALVAAAFIIMVVRAVFVRQSMTSAVDHWYWLLAAKAYREQRRLPVRIPGKYLLEDETQAYPPGFGWFLAWFPESFLRSGSGVVLVVIVDIAICIILCAAALALGLGAVGMLAVVIVYGSAPVLVAYNAQMTSRGLGTLFLVVKMLAEVAATATDGPTAALLWALAIAAAAAVILTHKMTTQFMIALWPVWPFALSGDGSMAMVALVPLAGLAVAAVVTGPSFQIYQWRAHADIVAFWHRNRDLLGAHAFDHSPVYGDPARAAETTFHKPGLAGWLAHARLVFGYAPVLALAPLTTLFAAAPPTWVWVWMLGAYAVAAVTLYVPALRCFGGGHLYVFSAVPAGALWWADALASGGTEVIAIFTFGVALTAVALATGWRRRALRRPVPDRALSDVIAAIGAAPPTRVAVFPLTAAERVAYETHHAVLWGGHGYGFRRVEPIFPVVRERIGAVLALHETAMLLIDARWWPGADAMIAREFAGAEVRVFGDWRWVITGAPFEPSVARS